MAEGAGISAVSRRRRRWTRLLVGMLSLVLLLPLVPYSLAYLGEIQVPNPGADLWRDVRQRGDDPAQGVTQVKGVDAGVLINQYGEEWRLYRSEKLVPLGGYLMGGVLAAIALFFLIRGRIRIPGGRSGRRVPRFTEYDRLLHWTTAFLFILLGITGLILLYGRFVLIPLLGPEGFAITASASKEAHNLFGPAFAVVIVLLFFRFVSSNVPKWVDVKWILKGGGILGGHASAGFLNGGEKIWFWVVILLGTAISVSGLILDFPNFGQSRVWMGGSLAVHGTAAVILIAGLFGHIYIGTLGMEGSLEGMTTGSVDENWAEAHHDLWMEERRAKGAEPVSPAEPVPPAETEGGATEAVGR
jgi:formate dehydrogenase subunit gamma